MVSLCRTPARWLMAALGAVAFFAAAAAIVPAQAEVRVSYETGGETLFSVMLPDGWVAASGSQSGLAPRILSLNPEDDLSLWIGLFSPPGPRSLIEAEQYVRNVGRRIVSDARVERQDDAPLGTLAARYYHGSGEREGAPVGFAVAIAQLPARDRFAVAVFVGENGAREVYGAEIVQIVSSFRVEEMAQ